jgi:hypothetical protein
MNKASGTPTKFITTIHGIVQLAFHSVLWRGSEVENKSFHQELLYYPDNKLVCYGYVIQPCLLLEVVTAFQCSDERCVRRELLFLDPSNGGHEPYLYYLHFPFIP